MNGIIVLDKPSGPTSRDALNRVLQQLPRKTKIGHAGTLDPLASGILLLALGDATRLIEYLQEMPKTYRTTIRLGVTSTTDDADGEITPGEDLNRSVGLGEIEAALRYFQGEVLQIPPAYSAIKVGGRRAHDMARRQKPLELASRPVRIDRIELLGYDWPRLELRIYCGKGTYIRSIARDLGAKLGCGGLVEMLVRESVGPFELSKAISIDAYRETIVGSIQPMALAVPRLPSIILSEEDVREIFHGTFLPREGQADEAEIALFDERGNLIAIAKRLDGLLKPQKVFKNRDATPVA